MPPTRRRMHLLGEIIRSSGGRDDVGFHMHPEITIRLHERFGGLSGSGDYASEVKIELRDMSQEPTSEISNLLYDYRKLLDAGLVDADLYKGKNALFPTEEGFAAYAEWTRPWWLKAYDKQPVTFLQAVLTILIAIASWAIGRYLTPALP